MQRFALPFLAGLALITAPLACGDDKSSSCGPGTVLQNGQCVPVTEADTVDGTDTMGQDTAQPPQDTATQPPDDTTGPPPDTTQVTDTTVSPNECTPEEAGSRDLGDPCTKNCQCDQTPGNAAGLETPNFCYSGGFMNGFSFCTRRDAGDLFLGAVYDSLLLVPTCFAQSLGNEANQRIYLRKCESLSDCKQRHTGFTHCGTAGLGYQPAGSPNEFMCINQTVSGCSTQTMASNKKFCIIEDLPPFAEAKEKCGL